MLASSGEHGIIAKFNETYERSLSIRRESRKEQDAIDAKATAICEQKCIIKKANQDIEAAKRQIAEAQDRIAFAQRRIADLK